MLSLARDSKRTFQPNKIVPTFNASSEFRVRFNVYKYIAYASLPTKMAFRNCESFIVDSTGISYFGFSYATRISPTYLRGENEKILNQIAWRFVNSPKFFQILFSPMIKHASFTFIISFAFLLQFFTLPASSAELPLLLKTEKNETICVGKTKINDFSGCDTKLGVDSTDRGTRKILLRSDEIIPVFSQPVNAGHYFLLIARIPSKLPQGPVYCGAGYEDHLILLEYSKKKIALRDDLLLQSCLTPISLAGDGGGNILESISVDIQKYAIRFTWLGVPDDKEHILTISKGRFLVE